LSAAAVPLLSERQGAEPDGKRAAMFHPALRGVCLFTTVICVNRCLRLRTLPGLALAIVALSGCAPADEPQCSGTLITAPATGAMGTSQLMAHAAAMGMTQSEAQTLLYLEGISPQATLQPGESLCLDGTPD
jgi:hypothetical protein